MPAVHFVNVHTVCQSVQYICFAHNKPSNIPGVATWLLEYYRKYAQNGLDVIFKNFCLIEISQNREIPLIYPSSYDVNKL